MLRFAKFFAPHLFEDDFSNKTNKEVFASLAFPGHLIPIDFRERVNSKIEIINEAPEDNETLQVSLTRFIRDVIKLAGDLQRIQEQVDKIPYSNQAKLDEVKYKTPANPLFCDPITNRVMTHPVIINKGLETELIINFRSLLQFWHDNQCKFAHPSTHELIETIQFYPDLQKVITHFVDFEVKKIKGFDISIEAIDTQIIAVKDKMAKFAKKTALEIMEQDHPAYFTATPQEFIEANTDGYIMTHPVKIDDKWTVCYLELERYWRNHPYQNPFNEGHRIRSLIYLDELKARLDAYTKDPKKYLKETEAAKKAEIKVTEAPHASILPTSTPLPSSTDTHLPVQANNSSLQQVSPPPLLSVALVRPVSSERHVSPPRPASPLLTQSTFAQLNAAPVHLPEGVRGEPETKSQGPSPAISPTP